MTRPRLGRPAGPPEAVRERHVRVPVNEAEGAALDAWSKRAGRPLAELVRETALRAAKRASGDPSGDRAARTPGPRKNRP